MSKLMFIFGILFLAAGVALGFLIHFSPGEMQVRGLTAGCGGNSSGGRRPVPGAGRHHRGAARPDRCTGCGGSRSRDAEAVEKPATPKFTGFGKKTAATAVAAEASAAVAETAAASKTSVADTVAALEQAKTDIAVALGVEPQKAAAAEPVAAKPEPEGKPEAADGESSMWWRRKSFAAARPGCCPMAPWKPKPTTAGCALKTSNTSTNISKLWCQKRDQEKWIPVFRPITLLLLISA